MSFITWSPDLAVNVRQIDEQHAQLIKMVNDLHDAMLQGHGKETLQQVLMRLIKYTQSHFAAEEALMMKHSYAEYGRHKAEHEALIQKVGAYVKDFKEGKPGLVFSLNTFLKEWLTKHIMGSDKKYAPHLKAKGVS
jgi:hemerythrin